MFTIYNDGEKFLTENFDILNSRPLETVFFEVNARNLKKQDGGFAIRAEQGDDILLAIHCGDFPMALFGSEKLCAELSAIIFKRGLKFKSVLSNEKLATTFLSEYEKLAGGTHRTKLSMDIMKCVVPVICDTSRVEKAKISDIAEIAKMRIEFQIEATHKNPCEIDSAKNLEEVRDNIENFVLIRQNGKIAAIAQISRETQYLCAITCVYTRAEFRGRHFAKMTVTNLAQKITEQKKLAYLFVDKTNPISNRLYSGIGFVYDAPQVEMELAI